MIGFVRNTIIASLALSAIACGAGDEGPVQPTGRVAERESMTVQWVDPNSGPTTGGTRVTVRGSGFRVGMAVMFGSVAGTQVTVIDPTLLTVLTPPSQPGEVNLLVGSGATSTSAPVRYRYVLEECTNCWDYD